MGVATIKQKNMAMGSWYQIDRATGEKTPISEPSIHGLIEGQESEILRRAAALGKKHNQQAVVVAVHDEAAEGRVFTLRLGDVRDDVLEATTAHFVTAGLGGAITFLDKPEFRFLAEDAEAVAIVELAAVEIPDEFEPKLSSVRARVDFVGSDRYDELLTASPRPDGGIRADVFISGVRTSWSSRG